MAASLLAVLLNRGIYFLTVLLDGTRYQLWSGDKWACPQCEREIISGVGKSPIAEHFQPDFTSQLAKFQPELTVKV